MKQVRSWVAAKELIKRVAVESESELAKKDARERSIRKGDG